MHVGRGKVVTLEYTLRNDRGAVVEQVQADSPLYYLHGYQNIVPGLEDALTGLKAGDAFDVVVPPEKGFGKREEKLLMELPFTQLPAGLAPMKGQRLQVSLGNQVRHVIISKVKLKSVVVDANHEFADQTLRYTGSVCEVRPATSVELKHGHAHSPHDHHHH